MIDQRWITNVLCRVQSAVSGINKQGIIPFQVENISKVKKIPDSDFCPNWVQQL